MQITVGRVTKDSKMGTYDKWKGRTFWGVMANNIWYDVFTDNKPAVGEMFDISVEESQYKGKTYRRCEILNKPQSAPAPKARPQPNGGTNRTMPYTHPWSEYEDMARKAYALARELEPTPEQGRARSAILNTIMMAYGDGKLDPTDGWPSNGKDDGWPKDRTEGQALHAETQAHIDLENFLADPGSLMGNYQGKTLSEISSTGIGKAVNQVRALTAGEANLILNEIVDWQKLLARGVKQYCLDHKLDFNSKKLKIVGQCAEGKTSILAMSQTQAREALQKLKALSTAEINDDDIPF